MDEFAAETYWEGRYACGGTSGAGSYGTLQRYKARFLNRFVIHHQIRSVVELGCGDGAQLGCAIYPEYTGYDVSPSAVSICRDKFRFDSSKRFFVGSEASVRAELALSLDVVYHLTETPEYDHYLDALFSAATRFVVIYGNDFAGPSHAAHIRLRDVPGDVEKRFPEWRLNVAERNPHYSRCGILDDKTWANFIVYEKAVDTVPTTGSPPVDILEPLSVTATMIILGNAAVETALTPRLARLAFLDRVILPPDPTGWSLRLAYTPNLRLGSAVVVLDGASDIEAEIRALSRIPTLDNAPLVIVDANRPKVQATVTSLVRKFLLEERIPEVLGCPLQADCFIGTLKTRPTPIISLTTIRSRAANLDRVLGSLIDQSIPAEHIRLHISPEPFMLDEGLARQDLPLSVLRLEEAGLIDVIETPNLGPYRKLLFSLQTYWDANVVLITADDDTIYPHHWLRGLYQAYCAHGGVTAYRCNTMCIEHGMPIDYLAWTNTYDNAEVDPAHAAELIFPTGKDGILYPPSAFTPHVFDEAFRKKAPYADDLFFKINTMITQTGVTRVPYRDAKVPGPEFPQIGGTGGKLFDHNAMGNNIQLIKLLNYAERQGIYSLDRVLKHHSVNRYYDSIQSAGDLDTPTRG